MPAEKIVMLWSSKIYKILIYAMRFTQLLVSVCISILPLCRRPNSVSVTFLPSGMMGTGFEPHLCAFMYRVFSYSEFRFPMGHFFNSRL
jgi:hypothetical protein